MLIITFGSEGRTVDELLRLVAQHGIVAVVDVRRMPDQQGTAWSRDTLKAALGSRYAWLRGLSATNLRTALVGGAEATYADLHSGLKTLGAKLATERVWRVVFLGDAPNPMHDARGHLSRRFVEEMGANVVDDLPAKPASQEGSGDRTNVCAG